MSIRSVKHVNSGIRAMLMLMVVASLCVAGSAAAAVCRVTTDGTADGISWSQARNLQNALITASCSEVWVKAGAYKPGAARNDYFRIPVINNTTFSGNSNPAEFGGAIYSYASNDGTSSAKLSNVTFNGNAAALGGSAV